MAECHCGLGDDCPGVKAHTTLAKQADMYRSVARKALITSLETLVANHRTEFDELVRSAARKQGVEFASPNSIMDQFRDTTEWLMREGA